MIHIAIIHSIVMYKLIEFLILVYKPSNEALCRGPKAGIGRAWAGARGVESNLEDVFPIKYLYWYYEMQKGYTWWLVALLVATLLLKLGFIFSVIVDGNSLDIKGILECPPKVGTIGVVSSGWVGMDGVEVVFWSKPEINENFNSI